MVAAEILLPVVQRCLLVMCKMVYKRMYTLRYKRMYKLVNNLVLLSMRMQAPPPQLSPCLLLSLMPLHPLVVEKSMEYRQRVLVCCFPKPE